MFHEPVLVEEVVERLLGELNGVYVDGTVGGGGHAHAILNALGPRGKLIALDRDEEALLHARTQLQAFEDRLIVRKSNFRELDQILEELNIKGIHGFLLDLGVSSHQIDTAERGFSYGAEGDLDMRMDKQQDLTAADLVNTWSEDELFRVFKEYGEERRSRAVVWAIIKERKRTRIDTTQALRETVSKVLPAEHRVKSLARIFQALRIAVNDELQSLSEALKRGLECLLPGGRIVIISYHSLEDRTVKEFFKYEASRCICPTEFPVCVCGKKGRVRILTKRPVRPSADEVKRNPRSRSAKLRAAEAVSGEQGV